jgi:hypothetical protein
MSILRSGHRLTSALLLVGVASLTRAEVAMPEEYVIRMLGDLAATGRDQSQSSAFLARYIGRLPSDPRTTTTAMSLPPDESPSLEALSRELLFASHYVVRYEIGVESDSSSTLTIGRYRPEYLRQEDALTTATMLAVRAWPIEWYRAPRGNGAIVGIGMPDVTVLIERWSVRASDDYLAIESLPTRLGEDVLFLEPRGPIEPTDPEYREYSLHYGILRRFRESPHYTLPRPVRYGRGSTNRSLAEYLAESYSTIDWVKSSFDLMYTSIPKVEFSVGRGEALGLASATVTASSVLDEIDSLSQSLKDNPEWRWASCRRYLLQYIVGDLNLDRASEEAKPAEAAIFLSILEERDSAARQSALDGVADPVLRAWMKQVLDSLWGTDAVVLIPIVGYWQE